MTNYSNLFSGRQNPNYYSNTSLVVKTHVPVHIKVHVNFSEDFYIGTKCMTQNTLNLCRGYFSPKQAN